VARVQWLIDLLRSELYIFMKTIYRCIVMLFVSGCVSAQSPGFMNNPIFQSIRVGNGGQKAIIEPRIEYGGAKLINRSQKIFAPPKPGRPPGDFVIEGVDLPITEEAIVQWKSEAGESHSIVAPVRSFIRDKNVFYGFHFVFVDDHVDIYLIQRKKFKVATTALETFEMKVFSSAP
jgi:hypothetical protein